MSRNARLPHHETIHQYLKEQRFDLYFIKPALRHMVHFLNGATEKGFSGTLTDLHDLSYETRHRTTLSHFLHKGVWDDRWLEGWILKQSITRIVKHSEQTGLPIYVLLDDTLMEKKKPSSHATHGIEGADFRFSHVKGKSIWGHNLVMLFWRCGDLRLPFACRLYTKDSVSRIDLAKELIQLLPDFHLPAYLLMDTWYTCASLLDVAAQKGLQVIGGLKTNRILYPAGIGTPANQFASHISQSETHLVTVGDDRYHVYRYEGSLNKIPNAIVLFCWPDGTFGDPKSLRMFLSTDVSISTESLLSHYTCRWAIETFFQCLKSVFSMDRYQIRHVSAIRRFLLLLLLTYIYCEQAGHNHVSQGLSFLRKDRKRQLIEWVYTQAQEGIPLSEVKRFLCVA
jgi:hypothetical protein